MNIDLLSKMVRELILDNDCVALPGFGVFIAEIVPASFSDKGYTLNPPYRRLHFRAKDVQDDALAGLYASSNGVELGLARTIVTDFVAELKKVLQKNKVVIFPGLGRLRATKENNFFFVPDEDIDIYPEGFGLEPISLKTHQETEEEVAAVVGDLAGMIKDVSETAAEVPEGDVCQEVQERHEADDAVLPVMQEVESPGKPEKEQEQEIEFNQGDSADTSLSGQTAVRGRDRRKVVRTVLIAAGIIAGVLALALLVFLVVAETWPDFMDSILYSKEELEILNAMESI